MKTTPSKSKVIFFHSFHFPHSTLIQNKIVSKAPPTAADLQTNLRRTSRTIKAKYFAPYARSDDYYLMGHQELDRIIGIDPA